MKRAIVFYWLSAVLLASSIAAIALNARDELMGAFGYFAWIHVGVIITCGYATIELRRISRMSPPPAIPKVREISVDPSSQPEQSR